MYFDIVFLLSTVTFEPDILGDRERVCSTFSTCKSTSRTIPFVSVDLLQRTHMCFLCVMLLDIERAGNLSNDAFEFHRSFEFVQRSSRTGM